ncbi:MAG: hypothetical protein FWF20_05865 [Betaproteobacteria bacterium]|nr:hypothetical protein [Betaproteobacteria bacterium]MCL2886298.1 hypothetical protein [Betaproteobacteria bacterium]
MPEQCKPRQEKKNSFIFNLLQVFQHLTPGAAKPDPGEELPLFVSREQRDWAYAARQWPLRR